MSVSLHDLSFGTRQLLFLAYSVISARWVYSFSGLKPGFKRLFFSLPICLANFFVPFIFDREVEVCSHVTVGFLLIWLANFKVIGSAFNRGPLVHLKCFTHFWIVLLFPITPQLSAGASKMQKVASSGKLTTNGGSAQVLAVRFLAKTAFLGISVAFLVLVPMPAICTEAFYALGLYSFLGFMMDGPATLVTSLIGLPISPLFDHPFLADSLADFWGRRWNLTASNTLRSMVYDPIYEGRLISNPNVPVRLNKRRRVLGMLASFIVSGLVHELMFWYATRIVTWKWLIYFTIQGPLSLLEHLIFKQARKHGLVIDHPLLKIPLTLCSLMLVARFFFFRPCIETGLADTVVNSISSSFQSVVHLGGLDAVLEKLGLRL